MSVCLLEHWDESKESGGVHLEASARDTGHGVHLDCNCYKRISSNADRKQKLLRAISPMH